MVLEELVLLLSTANLLLATSGIESLVDSDIARESLVSSPSMELDSRKAATAGMVPFPLESCGGCATTGAVFLSLLACGRESLVSSDTCWGGDAVFTLSSS